jgi:hypothetical protein
MRVVIIIMIAAIMVTLVYAVHLVSIPIPKVSYFKSELSGIMTKGKVTINLPPLVAEERKKSRAGEWVRNPFSFIQSAALLGDLELQAISIDAEGKGLVVIDGEIYREGDVVGIYKIIKIGKDYIVVNRGGSNIIIRLEKGE